MVPNSQESRYCYWFTRSFAYHRHSLALSCLLCFACTLRSFIWLFACSFTGSWGSEFCLEAVLNHSAMAFCQSRRSDSRELRKTKTLSSISFVFTEKAHARSLRNQFDGRVNAEGSDAVLRFRPRAPKGALSQHLVLQAADQPVHYLLQLHPTG